VTKKINIILPIIYAFISFIFPFEYPYNIISFLSRKNLGCLYVLIRSLPTPFIAGIHQEEYEEAKIHFNEKLYIVFLDENSVDSD